MSTNAYTACSAPKVANRCDVTVYEADAAVAVRYNASKDYCHHLFASSGLPRLVSRFEQKPIDLSIILRVLGPVVRNWRVARRRRWRSLEESIMSSILLEFSHLRRSPLE